MKRIIVLFLVLCVMISLVSCDIRTEKTGKIIVNLKGLCEIDFENGTIHRFCPLKNCKHNDKTCPFYEMYSVKRVGDYLYYLQDYNICYYNMKTGEYGSLYTSDKNLRALFADEKYLFFAEGWDFMKFDIATGEKTLFCENIAYFSSKVYAVGNGRVYYKIGTVYYSVDYDGKNIIKEDKYEEPQKGLSEAGNWALSVLQYQSKNLISINLDDGSRNMILQKVGACACYNGKIIYSKTDDNESTDKAMNRNGDTLYMCNPDGTEKELLCDISGLLCCIANEFGAIDAIGSGDWIAVQVSQYAYNSNFIDYYYDENPQFIKSRYLLVNIVTGEFKFAKEV